VEAAVGDLGDRLGLFPEPGECDPGRRVRLLDDTRLRDLGVFGERPFEQAQARPLRVGEGASAGDLGLCEAAGSQPAERRVDALAGARDHDHLRAGHLQHRGAERDVDLVVGVGVQLVDRRLPAVHRLPLLWLDWSGARVAAVDLTLVGDYDEPRRRVRLRRSATKTRTALWVDLPDVLADALEATLPHRRFRDPDGRLFAGSGADALRTSIARACKAEGVPLFSPHDLRHRRISLLHRQGRSWAEVARFVGQRNLKVTADTYTHVLVDGREVDYAGLLATG
jgi:integrase